MPLPWYLHIKHTIIQPCNYYHITTMAPRSVQKQGFCINFYPGDPIAWLSCACKYVRKRRKKVVRGVNFAGPWTCVCVCVSVYLCFRANLGYFVSSQLQKSFVPSISNTFSNSRCLCPFRFFLCGGGHLLVWSAHCRSLSNSTCCRNVWSIH